LLDAGNRLPAERNSLQKKNEVKTKKGRPKAAF
jgi:hypothetical protein